MQWWAGNALPRVSACSIQCRIDSFIDCIRLSSALIRAMRLMRRILEKDLRCAKNERQVSLGIFSG